MKELNSDGVSTSETGLISTNGEVAKKQWNTPKLVEVDYQHTFSSAYGYGGDAFEYS